VGVRSTTPYEAQRVRADDTHEREFTGHLNQYYAEVIAAIRDAESILIFGPGEARGELKKRLDHAKLGGHIIAMETVDKMTDRQVAAKVRGTRRRRSFLLRKGYGGRDGGQAGVEEHEGHEWRLGANRTEYGGKRSACYKRKTANGPVALRSERRKGARARASSGSSYYD